MHTVEERKFLALTHLGWALLDLEVQAKDVTGRPQYVVGPIEREFAIVLADALRDWMGEQADWLGNKGGVPRWVNVKRRSPEQIADFLREVILRWINGDLPELTLMLQTAIRHTVR